MESALQSAGVAGVGQSRSKLGRRRPVTQRLLGAAMARQADCGELVDVACGRGSQAA
jgi:hypothetical protein